MPARPLSSLILRVSKDGAGRRASSKADVVERLATRPRPVAFTPQDEG
ncbi:hypothetical protein [Rhizobium leguminosarum]|uniref:Uncharacterized protein n=1 Tax=Rhizobium leguminosarum TaxID=384 RepID=A0A2Z4YHB4_RHILE|nr:hypothetical protein [Rhizobium leguminosarum]AXA40837.1 hypothetical protein DLJ82_3265 [Rhizobium leguminosarum]